jgi:hypothetical protein
VTAVNIPDEALHHAREAFVRGRAGRSGVAAAVEAAAPLILAAELDRIAEYARLPAALGGSGVPSQGDRHAQAGFDYLREELRRRAAELRGEARS